MHAYAICYWLKVLWQSWTSMIGVCPQFHCDISYVCPPLKVFTYPHTHTHTHPRWPFCYCLSPLEAKLNDEWTSIEKRQQLVWSPMDVSRCDNGPLRCCFFQALSNVNTWVSHPKEEWGWSACVASGGGGINPSPISGHQCSFVVFVFFSFHFVVLFCFAMIYF